MSSGALQEWHDAEGSVPHPVTIVDLEEQNAQRRGLLGQDPAERLAWLGVVAAAEEAHLADLARWGRKGGEEGREACEPVRRRDGDDGRTNEEGERDGVRCGMDRLQSTTLNGRKMKGGRRTSDAKGDGVSAGGPGLARSKRAGERRRLNARRKQQQLGTVSRARESTSK